MSKSKWSFFRISPDSGGGGDLNKAVRAQDDPADLVGREVVQNSWDAARKLRSILADEDINFRVEFRFREFRGEDKRAVVKALALTELADRRAEADISLQPLDGSILDHLSDDDPLRVLYISDFGAHGLYGHPQKHTTESVLFNAIYFMGGSRKPEGDYGTGGSYGFGKSAFIRGSRLRTVFAYSAFRPYPNEINEDDPVTRRLVGFCWWNDHKVGKRSFDGRAQFAAETTEKWGRQPHEDQDADRIASKLGIPLRDATDTEALGTTLMIVDPTVTAEDLRDALQKWWWPALEQSDMDLIVMDENDREWTIDPASDPYLRPFIDAYRIAQGDRAANGSSEKQVISPKWKVPKTELAGGTCVVLVPGAEAAAEAASIPVYDDESPESSDVNGTEVALMRDPRMVVQYRTFQRHRVPIKGVYVASHEVDGFLRDTEPPLHDKWSLSSQDDIPSESTRVAKAIHEKVGRAVREFAKEVAPPPTVPQASLAHMNKLVAKFLKKGPGKPPPPPPPPPISIHYVRAAEATVSGDDIVMRATVEVGLGAVAGERRDVSVGCRFQILEEEAHRGGDDWPVHVKALGESHGLTEQADQTWQGALVAGSPVRFDIESEPYDPTWSGHLTPEVTLLATGSVEQ